MLKSRVALALSFVFTLLLLFMKETQTFGFMFLYALIILCLLALISILRLRRDLQVFQEISQPMTEKNQVVHFTQTIENTGFFPYYCKSCSYTGARFFRGFGPVTTRHLPPRRHVTDEYSLSFSYRGKYDIGLEHLLVTDFLGLFAVSVPLSSPLSVLVKPTQDPRFQKQESGQRDSGFLSASFEEDYSSIADIRPYQPGDHLKTVHWPLTAKWNELMIKNFDSEAGSQVLLFLDTKKVPLAGDTRLAFEDAIVSFVAAAAAHFLHAVSTTHFIYGISPAERLEINEQLDTKTLDHILAEVPFSYPHSIISYYHQILPPDSHPLFYYFFLFDVSKEGFEYISHYISSGHTLILYYFYCEHLPLTLQQKEWLERLRLQGVLYYLVEVETP